MLDRNDNTLIMNVNFAGVIAAYGLLGVSLWVNDQIPLSTKGYWGMGIVLLTLSLINVVKYKFDQRLNADRIKQIEDAKNEKMLEEALKDSGQ